MGSLKPRFIEDPYKKVSYSFRIEERLLEDIKKYSNATNRKLPETFNYLLKKSLEGVNVNNSYLEDYEGLIINIPYMTWEEQIYYAGDTIGGTELIFRRGNTNYLDYSEEGLTYEVKQIPNNLDIWINEKPIINIGETQSKNYLGQGYYSKHYPNLIHEGISIVIAPELVLSEGFNICQTGIINTLKFIYFAIDLDSNITVSNISYKESFRKLKESGNEETIYKFNSIYNTIYKFGCEFMKMYEEETEPELESDDDFFKSLLYSNLVKFANKYNDGNITSIEDKTKAQDISDLNLTTLQLIEDVKESTSNDYLNIIDNLKKDLEDKDTLISVQDGLIKDYKQKLEDTQEEVNNLVNTFEDINRRLEELESKK